ncbi:MAG: extracellular solute-binding protein [Clostridia bacterium]|nr:extracellular solute-binding protein [Clostridia bacterium]
MTKKVIRLITLVLAIAMIASLAVGCGGDGSASGGGKGDAKIDGLLPEVNPADYAGTTVTLATWKDPYQNEDGPVCDKFEQEYGINFEWQMIDQGEYVNTIAAAIASNQQPDVFFENGDFPGSLTVMQPLDAAKLDLTAPIWNQALIKASTLDGHPYLVDAISNVWTELDICVYNKNIFESNGLTTPEEYYEAGEWTFASFREAAKQVTALGKEYSGAGVLDEAMLGAAGCTVFQYKDQTLSNGVDAHFVEVLTAMSQMRVDGYLKLDRFGFDDGKQGMCFTNCFGLKKTGYFTHLNPEYIGATYLPVWEKGDEQVYTGIYRGWGLIEGSKNPVGAGIFMRYYLDVNNYDLQQTFHNQDVTNFFFKLVGAYSDNVVYYRGPDMMKTTGLGERFGYAFMYESPDNIKKYLDGKMPEIDLMIQKGNEIIKEELEWIEQAELANMINKVD